MYGRLTMANTPPVWCTSSGSKQEKRLFHFNPAKKVLVFLTLLGSPECSLPIKTSGDLLCKFSLASPWAFEVLRNSIVRVTFLLGPGWGSTPSRISFLFGSMARVGLNRLYKKQPTMYVAPVGGLILRPRHP